MANLRSLPFLILIIIIIASSSLPISYAGPKLSEPSRTVKMSLKKSVLHLFWHDVVSGRHPSGVTVIQGPINGTAPAAAAASGLGMTRMIDNPLTAGPRLSSTEFGRAQGFYAMVAAEPSATLMMVMNFAFTMGKYNGSSLNIIGRNPVFDHVREMAIVGGSGLFRCATGFARLRTQWFDQNTGDAIVKYTLVVLHY